MICHISWYPAVRQPKHKTCTGFCSVHVPTPKLQRGHVYGTSDVTLTQERVYIHTTSCLFLYFIMMLSHLIFTVCSHVVDTYRQATDALSTFVADNIASHWLLQRLTLTLSNSLWTRCNIVSACRPLLRLIILLLARRSNLSDFK